MHAFFHKNNYKPTFVQIRFIFLENLNEGPSAGQEVFVLIPLEKVLSAGEQREQMAW